MAVSSISSSSRGNKPETELNGNVIIETNAYTVVCHTRKVPHKDIPSQRHRLHPYKESFHEEHNKQYFIFGTFDK